jgi:V-type H+-transporting ATPase subunit B
LEFLDAFEKKFINQGAYENRTIYDSLDIAWSLMRMLPKEMLTRVNPKILKEFYGRRAQGSLKKAAEDGERQDKADDKKKQDKSTRDGESKLVDDD